MRDELNKIINSDFSTIERDGDLSLLLLMLYSKLFLNGKQPPACASCMREMHRKLKNKGIKLLEIMENKTCVLKDGIHGVRAGKGIMHYSNNNITDEIAIELLENGQLKESHFEVLPQKKSKAIALDKENIGNFDKDNLSKYNGKDLMAFSEELTGEKPKSKKVAIENILNWQNK
jgi:hypothetical protein